MVPGIPLAHISPSGLGGEEVRDHALPSAWVRQQDPFTTVEPGRRAVFQELCFIAASRLDQVPGFRFHKSGRLCSKDTLEGS